MKFAISQLLAIALFAAQPVHALENDDAINKLKGITKDIDGMRPVPLQGLMMVQTKEGVFFISSNGQFVFKGAELYDMWNRQEVQTFEDLEKASMINLHRMGVKLEDLSSYNYGTGDKEVVLFVDPKCPYCNKTLGTLSQYKDRYTFRIVMLPIMGKESEAIVAKLECMADKSKAIEYILHTAWDKLPQVDIKTCDLSKVHKARVTAQVIGIKAVPFLIATNGRASSGYKKDLSDYLKKNEL